MCGEEHGHQTRRRKTGQSPESGLPVRAVLCVFTRISPNDPLFWLRAYAVGGDPAGIDLRVFCLGLGLGHLVSGRNGRLVGFVGVM